MNTIKFHSWEGHKCILVEDVLELIDEIANLETTPYDELEELKERIKG